MLQSEISFFNFYGHKTQTKVYNPQKATFDRGAVNINRILLFIYINSLFRNIQSQRERNVV